MMQSSEESVSKSSLHKTTEKRRKKRNKREDETEENPSKSRSRSPLTRKAKRKGEQNDTIEKDDVVVTYPQHTSAQGQYVQSQKVGISPVKCTSEKMYHMYGSTSCFNHPVKYN